MLFTQVLVAVIVNVSPCLGKEPLGAKPQMGDELSKILRIL
jgi:hypothetical protein